jgi:hypothetical protein
MASSEFVVQSRQKGEPGTLVPIGTRAEIEAALALLNTAPEAPGGDILYGPGFEMHFTAGQDPVLQILVTQTEDSSIFRATIWEIAKRLQWKLVDPGSEAEYNP